MSALHPAGQLFQLDRDHCLFLLATKRVGRLVGGNHESPMLVLNYVLRGDEVVARIDRGLAHRGRRDRGDVRGRRPRRTDPVRLERDRARCGSCRLGNSSVVLCGWRHRGARTRGSMGCDRDRRRDRAPRARRRRRRPWWHSCGLLVATQQAGVASWVVWPWSAPPARVRLATCEPAVPSVRRSRRRCSRRSIATSCCPPGARSGCARRSRQTSWRCGGSTTT